MTDWKDIPGNKEHLTENELLEYLYGNPSAAARRSTREKIDESAFEKEALEGLMQVKTAEALNDQVNHLKKDLNYQLSQRRNKRTQKNILLFRWILLAILLLLFVCIMGYALIKMHLGEM